MIRSASLVTALVLAAAASPAAADIDLTTGTIGNFAPFGTPDTTTYGQTFLPTSGASNLLGFSLFLNSTVPAEGPLDLRGYLGTWDGSKLGTLLYTSTTRTMNAEGSFQEFVFTPAAPVPVVEGQTYVAFLSVADLPAQSPSQFGMPGVFNTISGNWVFLNNASSFADLSTTPWASDRDLDVYITVDFDGDATGAVPEPGSWAMLIAGFGLTGAVLRRRRPLSA